MKENDREPGAGGNQDHWMHGVQTALLTVAMPKFSIAMIVAFVVMDMDMKSLVLEQRNLQGSQNAQKCQVLRIFVINNQA